jgi:short-subunit dehydrogenase
MAEEGVVWITGASAGIGEALALEYARQGYRVAVSARREERLRGVAARIDELGGEGFVVPCDVTEEEAIARTVSRIVDRFGRLDVAVANAGFVVSGHIEELSAEEWRRQFDVNVVGLAVTARHALPHLRETRGRLALVGSVAGFLPRPGTGAYAASKAAVRTIGQALSLELVGTGVSCTTIQPGLVESEIAQVDNRGVHHPDRPDGRPAFFMWPSERAARVMVRAIRRRRRDYVFTGHGRLGAFLGRHLWGLVHFAMARTLSRGRAAWPVSGGGRSPGDARRSRPG